MEIMGTVVDASIKIKNLAVPPCNRLKKLKGERSGQYSVRVNINGESVFDVPSKCLPRSHAVAVVVTLFL